MATVIKTAAEIEKIRISCRLAAEVLEMIKPYIKVGVTTEEINNICHDYIVNVQHAIPSSLDYCGFPKSICVSVNDVVCHGIPGPQKLRLGDIVNVDVTVTKDGYLGDTSAMFMVGKPSLLAEKIVNIARECLYLGIRTARPGAHLGDIGCVIQNLAEKHGFSVVREFCGHGIGRDFHEDPKVLHFGKMGTGEKLKPGMVFTIEPMINAGTPYIKTLGDNWTVVTRDHKLSAQWEHTILITETGNEVLTKRKTEKI